MTAIDRAHPVLRGGLLAAAFLLLACTRGPEPGTGAHPVAEAPAAAAPTAAAAAAAAAPVAALPQAHAAPGQGLPPGHPPTGAGAPTPTGAPSAAPALLEGEAARAAARAGGLSWDAKAPLQARTPGSRMRAAEYLVAGSAAPDEAVLTVHHFPGMGGSVDDNLQRWIGQFSQPDGKPSRDVAVITPRTVGGVEVTTLEVKGTFSASMGPMAPPSAAGGKPDYAMLGAVAAAPRGPVFFKLVGPRAAIESARGAFDGLIESLRPEPVQ